MRTIISWWIGLLPTRSAGYLFIIILTVSLISPGYEAFMIEDEDEEFIPLFADSEPSPENVYDNIETLSNWYRYLGTPGHSDAEDYIFSIYASLGLKTTRQEYTVQRRDGGVRGANVMGLLEGERWPNKLIVIGGHYDAQMYSTHGAYDNGAGASCVIELARFFVEYYNSESNFGPDVSILFANWDAEEGGGAGSNYFLENLDEKTEILAYINLDMFSLNYPIRNQIPGSTEEYYRLYLYTSPVSDLTAYSQIEFNDSTMKNFTIFQNTLINITYDVNDYPPEWVPVLDDTEANSDHKFFIQNSIPAVWIRGLHEYPKDTGDLNERNFKHTPVDTLDTMERYAGGKSELLMGINTGLTIAYQLVLEVMNISLSYDDPKLNCIQFIEDENFFARMNGFLIAIVVITMVIAGYYFLKKERSKAPDNTK